LYLDACPSGSISPRFAGFPPQQLAGPRWFAQVWLPLAREVVSIRHSAVSQTRLVNFSSGERGTLMADRLHPWVRFAFCRCSLRCHRAHTPFANRSQSHGASNSRDNTPGVPFRTRIPEQGQLEGPRKDSGVSGVGPRRDSGASDVGPRRDSGASGVGTRRDSGASGVGPRKDSGASDVGPRRDSGVSGVGTRRDSGASDVGPRRDFGVSGVGPRRDSGASGVGTRRDSGASGADEGRTTTVCRRGRRHH
jgi:hypothetical protein